MMKMEKVGLGSNFLVPLEIQTEILSKLPVKSLLRFKCAQKSWRNLIENPTFITMHLDSFGKHKVSFLLYNYTSLPNECFRGNNNKNIVGSESNEIIMPTKWILGEGKRYIIGSSNGLVCICYNLYQPDSFKIQIWNPTTRKYMELPSCDYQEEVGNKFVLGFGFCPRVNDYKVVKVINYFGSRYSPPSDVHVYSLSSNSWKKFAIGNSGQILLPVDRENGFSINGTCYWLGNQISSPMERLIVAYKFDENLILDINLPNHNNFQNTRSSNLLITEYQNLLSLITNGDVLNVFEIWVMKEYGVADSWVKQFSIEIPIKPNLYFPLMIMNFENNGELVLVEDRFERSLVWYNIKTNQIEEQKLLYELHQVISFKESLVSLPGGITAEFLEE